jgi:uncharacterized protein (DUF2384 family)
MTPRLTYPQTRYEPSPPPDLHEPATRERLSRSALKAFFRIVDRWKVSDETARDLFGGVSNGTFYKMKRESGRVLSADELLRISYLVGIFKALHVLYSESLADQWMSRPNTNPIFGGRTPLDYVHAGGIPAMQAVRRLLDARRGG